MFKVRIIPDRSVTTAASRMRCNCGWEDKAYANRAFGIAKEHIIKRHTTGLIETDDGSVGTRVRKVP